MVDVTGSVMIIPSNYRWTTGEPPKVLDQWYLLWYMLHDKAAHIKDTFKTWAPEQCAKFFNASDCININNHCSRSNQRKGHLTDSGQGIWRYILLENSHKITTLSTIWPYHQTQRLICTPTGQSLSAQPHQTPSLQGIHWRTPQDRENLPLKILLGCTILFC